MSDPTSGGGPAAATHPVVEPLAPADCDTLRADFGWALGVVYRAYLRAANHAVGTLPGGPRGYQVLAAATRTPPASQRAIAQQIGVDRTVMTYLLDDLERAGLVTRRPAPGDRRSRHVVATDAGRTRLAALDRLLLHAQEQVLRELDGPDRATLHCLLQRVALRLDAPDAANACGLVEDIAAAEHGATPAAEPGADQPGRRRDRP